MRVRTVTFPVREDPFDAIMDGVRLGGVMANSLVLPFIIVSYWLMGWTWWGLVWWGAWVFCMTLWGRAFGFAFMVEYEVPE